jgi:hypothetical protein
MFKLTDAADLEKAGKSIGNYFAKQAAELEKSHSLHKALAAHHEACKATHEGTAAACKAAHEAAGDGSEVKDHFHKSHLHHTAMAGHHDGFAKTHHAHAESLKAEIDALKAVAAEWGATIKADGTGAAVVSFSKNGSIEEKFTSVTDALVTKALEQISASPKVAELLEGAALEHVSKLINGKLGDKLMPTPVSAVAPPNTAKAVPRNGQPAAGEKANVPLEFEKLVALPGDDE